MRPVDRSASRAPDGSPSQDSARTTALVARLLRAHRRAALRRNSGDAAYTGYLVVFIGALTVPPAVIAMVEVVAEPGLLDPWPAHRFTVVVPLLLSGLLGLLWFSAREGTVRGPVQVSAPVIDWVLSLPVDRARFLTSALLRSAALRAAVGAVLGPLTLVLLWRTVLPMPSSEGSAWALLAQAGLAGALVGPASTACGALVVAHGSRALRALRPWHALVHIVLLGAAALIWILPLPVPPLRLWSWGGSALLAAGTLWLFGRAWRSLDLVEPVSLRERGTTASGLRSGLWLSDPSWFQVAVTERMDRADQDTGPVRGAITRGRGPERGSGPRFRLRPPRRARYLVLWRDLLGMVRTPYPVLRGCLLTGVALALVREDAELSGAAAAGWIAAPTVLLYLAATQLLAGARMDVADPRRIRYLPPTQSFGTIALMHGVLPLASLLVVAGAAVPLLVLGGAAPPEAGMLLLALPATVAGALVGVYRGYMPDELALGVETPMGNTAPLQMAAWHLSGLLGLLVVTAPVVLGTGLGWGPGVVLGLWWLDVLWVVAGTGWLVRWARKRARASLSA
ncbi:hypothetical protein [Nocardiopsis nanhaiensis]